MKSKTFIRSLLLTACLPGLGLPAAHAQAPESGSPVEVRQVELTGQLNLLTERTRSELLAQLRPSGPRKMSQTELARMLQSAQQWLDARLPQRYALSIPAQAIEGGVLSVQVQPRLTGLNVTGTPDFDEANVRASLPSLQQGKTLDGRYWADLRELQMANDNPLKLTTIDYDVKPDQGVRANVKAVSPYGKTQWTLGLSNTGNEIAGRGQGQLSAVNANLTGRDDVLNVAAGGSLSNPSNSYYLSVRYTRPDYVRHRSTSIEFTHSQGNVNLPFLSLGTVGSQGTFNELGLRQTYYLGDLGASFTGAKLALGASYIANESQSQWLGTTLAQSDTKTVPLSLSLESDLSPTPYRQSRLRLDWLASSASITGGGQSQQWQAARSGADSRYSVLRAMLNGRLDMDSQANVSWLYRGQYSAQKLLPALQFSTINPFTGVRGFVNATGAGDNGQVLRLDLESPRLGAKGNLRAHGFYDAGTKRGGNDERKINVASTGLGLRWSTDDRLIKVDAFVAHKLQGEELDKTRDSASQKGKNSLWLLTSYSF